jgi:hypothetical protein
VRRALERAGVLQRLAVQRSLVQVLRRERVCRTAHHHRGPRRSLLTYSDEKVANREIRVWHLVAENGIE